MLLTLETLEAADRPALAGFLEETAARAGTGGHRAHPMVAVLGVLAERVAGGEQVADLGPVDGRLLHGVLQAAFKRARAEAPEVEPVVRRLLGQVERQAYGPSGYQPPPLPWHDGELTDGLWQPERGWAGVQVFRAVPRHR